MYLEARDAGNGFLSAMGGQALTLRSLPTLMHLYLGLIYYKENWLEFWAEELLLGTERRTDGVLNGRKQSKTNILTSSQRRAKRTHVHPRSW